MRGTFVVLATLSFIACASTATPAPVATPGANPAADASAALPTGVASQASSDTEASLSPGADVLEVSATGSPGDYTFRVTLSSPDTGCDEYADWWEVLSAEGDLLYRRVLLHSHVAEQPFTRSGGPVPSQPEQELLVRGHMNTTGYGGTVLRGSVASGFTPAETAPDFLSGVENLAPLPTSCAF